MKVKKIVVVGAGPAGMMASIRAAQLKQDVTLIDKNISPGRKLLLSGKGRCNLTNYCDFDSFIARFSHHGQFLRDAAKIFFNRELMDFFQRRGLKLKVERQLRVFPESDKADSILDVLIRELESLKIKTIYRGLLKEIILDGKEVRSVLLGDNRRISADKVILATGGASYKFTGSSGEGLELVKRTGHSIVSLRPGLIALKTRPCYDLEGLTLKNIRIKFKGPKKQILSEIGELIFTDVGVSGPLVLTHSGRVVDWLQEGAKVGMEIDMKPALTAVKLEERVKRDLASEPRKNIKNIIKKMFPKRMGEIFIRVLRIDSDKQANQLTQEERRRIVSLLKAFPLEIKSSLPLENAMVTRGGVSLKEINPRTMESRIIKGLYFAGEMVDLDADTGGFNLQAAFSTGYLAGESAAVSQ